jgi:hypothetical protein
MFHRPALLKSNCTKRLRGVRVEVSQTPTLILERRKGSRNSKAKPQFGHQSFPYNSTLWQVSRFPIPAESGIGGSLPVSRLNRESGERELGISGSGSDSEVNAALPHAAPASESSESGWRPAGGFWHWQSHNGMGRLPASVRAAGRGTRSQSPPGPAPAGFKVSWAGPRPQLGWALPVPVHGSHHRSGGWPQVWLAVNSRPD